VAVRLARKAKAPIALFHCVRYDGCRFRVKFGPVLRLSGEEHAKAVVLEDVVRLNDLIEPIVRDHLDQWYWLNWHAPGNDYGRANGPAVVPDSGAEVGTKGRVYGYIDEYRDGVLTGWCRSPDSDHVLGVDIIIDGARVARVYADIYRQDLHGLGFGTGRHGFRVMLPVVETNSTVQALVTGTNIALENSGRPLADLRRPAA
jgi:hypothetical protein